GVRYRLPKTLMLREDGRPVRREYLEIDHCCERFALLDEWLDGLRLQRPGVVGRAAARLMRSHDVVTVALDRLSPDETVFLHPPGADVECDAARASIPVSRA